MGLLRNASVEEIVGQVVLGLSAAREANMPSLRNIVFMGMGEPLDNRKLVEEALGILTSNDAMGFGARHVTVSTVGTTESAIEAAAAWPGQLAWSLHAADDLVRAELVPTARLAVASPPRRVRPRTPLRPEEDAVRGGRADGRRQRSPIRRGCDRRAVRGLRARGTVQLAADESRHVPAAAAQSARAGPGLQATASLRRTFLFGAPITRRRSGVGLRPAGRVRLGSDDRASFAGGFSARGSRPRRVARRRPSARTLRHSDLDCSCRPRDSRGLRRAPRCP